VRKLTYLMARPVNASYSHTSNYKQGKDDSSGGCAMPLTNWEASSKPRNDFPLTNHQKRNKLIIRSQAQQKTENSSRVQAKSHQAQQISQLANQNKYLERPGTQVVDGRSLSCYHFEERRITLTFALFSK
jgi:hypothetical protein